MAQRITFYSLTPLYALRWSAFQPFPPLRFLKSIQHHLFTHKDRAFHEVSIRSKKLQGLLCTHSATNPFAMPTGEMQYRFALLVEGEAA